MYPKNRLATDYLYPYLFVTDHDKGYSIERYKEGLERGLQATEIHISPTGVWSTDNKDGSSTQSYECLGYHACTAPLLSGFLNSGSPVIVHYPGGGQIRIK